MVPPSPILSRLPFGRPAFALIFLLLGVASARADYPSILVIDSSASAAASVTGTSIDARQYVTGSGVLVLKGANGGNAVWGPDLHTALTSPTATGSWDGGMNVTLSGHTVAVPQVLVYYPSDPGPATMQGYDNNYLSPLCDSPLSGSFVQAYNGLPDGYIFNLGDGLPCYRYQAGANPVVINTQNGWPPSDVMTFPQSLYANGVQLNSTAFAEGIANGYWCDAYYGTATGDNSVDIHVYIASDSSTGNIWGNVGTLSFSNDLDSSQTTFTSQSSLGINTTAPQAAPQYGPSGITWDGIYLSFTYNVVNGGDVYYDPATTSKVIINSDDSVTAIQPYQTLTGSYDPNSQAFSNLPGIAPISADGMSMLGLPPGITVITTGWNPGGLANGNSNGYYQYPNGYYLPGAADYVLYRPDGNVVYKYTSGVSPNMLFQFSSMSLSQTPYYYQGGEMILDATSGWPLSSLPPLSAPSTAVYVNGIKFSLTGGNYNWGQWTDYEYDSFYSDSSQENGIYFLTEYDPSSVPLTLLPSSSFSIWGSQYAGGTFTSFNDFNFQGGSAYISFAPPSSNPNQGPPAITWNGVPLSFLYTDQNGADNYLDATGDQTVVIYNDDSVWADGSYSTSGTYNSATYQFDFSGDPNMQNFAAQDAGGELLGVPNGLELYFDAPGNAQSIQLGNGTYLSPSNTRVYTFQRTDGSYGIKYIGVPLNSFFIVQDNNGNYSSPVYLYQPAAGQDLSIDTTANGAWPTPSSIYPPVLYVNGSYTTIDMTTQSTSGSGQSQSGGVSFDVNPLANGQYAGLVSISWTWSAGGFSAAVSGSYGTFTAFSGSWDGTLFNSLPHGLVISTAPPSPNPSLGPPQISWNGVDLTYNPIASSVSGSNPTGADVYTDAAGLGLVATIAANGAVTLTAPNGASYSGTYTPSTSTPGTGAFAFTGTSPGAVTAINNQGNISGSNPNPSSPGQSLEVGGDLDIQGNFLTLGTWVTSGTNSLNALAVSYFDSQNGNPSLLQFAATHQLSDWIWSEATGDGVPPQISMMELDPFHRLILHDSTSQNAPAVTLDPNGPSRFKNAVLLAPQGDIGMGPFTTGTSP